MGRAHAARPTNTTRNAAALTPNNNFRPALAAPNLEYLPESLVFLLLITVCFLHFTNIVICFCKLYILIAERPTPFPGLWANLRSARWRLRGSCAGIAPNSLFPKPVAQNAATQIRRQRR